MRGGTLGGILKYSMFIRPTAVIFAAVTLCSDHITNYLVDDMCLRSDCSNNPHSMECSYTIYCCNIVIFIADTY